MSTLQSLSLNPTLFKNGTTHNISLYYQIFGLPLNTAPVVLVFHALTGNSTVTGELGWWKTLIGPEKTINTKNYTVVAFNIPGNGFGSEVTDWENWSTHDIAQLFWKGIDALKIKNIYAAIGGSLGGGIAWEMIFQRPNGFQHLIPIATHWKATDWVIGNVLIQQQILKNSSQPVHDARLHAMFLYRTPQSIEHKFNGCKQTDGQYQTESWLLHHGQKLHERFTLSAYLLMNHLLKTIGEDYDWSDLANLVQNNPLQIHQISIDTDLFFTQTNTEQTHAYLKNHTLTASQQSIQSIHGHDAFLIEFDQLNHILQPLFKA